MAPNVTLEEVLDLAHQLSSEDKQRLISRLAPETDAGAAVTRPTPRKSLRGLWRGLDITDEDIAEARRDMWGNFPREDI